jgi:cell division inhibitor SepF
MGAMHKMGVYFGLVEDDPERYVDHPADAPETPAPRARNSAVPRTVSEPISRQAAVAERRSATATLPAQHAVDSYRITTLHPRTYNEARAIGEEFRMGVPVIMNLTEMDDVDAKRLVDFSAGLVFGCHGSIERVTQKVFLLSPANVDVTAEDKARIARGGFFNQS